MEKKTKKMALKKLRNIEALIGYSDELIDDAVLMRHHENLTIDEDNFYESFLSLNIFDNFHTFKNLHKSINKTDWEIHSGFLLEINAYYMPYDNNISEYKILNTKKTLKTFKFPEIPAPFLQGDFFHLDRPKYLNIASLGYIIGHEL